MTPEAWGQIASVALQGVMCVIGGLVWPWAKQIASSLNELKASQLESNKQIERLNRRSRRHDREIASLKERRCGGNHEE